MDIENCMYMGVILFLFINFITPTSSMIENSLLAELLYLC